MINKYFAVAERIKGGDADTKAAYWIGTIDGVITTVVIGLIVWAVTYG